MDSLYKSIKHIILHLALSTVFILCAQYLWTQSCDQLLYLGSDSQAIELMVHWAATEKTWTQKAMITIPLNIDMYIALPYNEN